MSQINFIGPLSLYPVGMPDRLSFLVALLGLAGPAPVLGQELHPGIIGEDDRVLLEQQGDPWDAIGKVNVSTYGGHGECTGTLVAANVVITAAHCVVDVLNGPVPPQTIHFLAGLRGSDYKAHSIGNCLHFLKDYVPPGSPDLPTKVWETDVVAVVLKDALEIRPMPLADAVSADPGLRLTHVGYPGDHRFMPWVDFYCHLLRSDLAGPIWFNDCDTHPGSSGGPVLIEDGGTYKLAAIMLGSAARLYNVALPVPVWRDLAENATCP